MYRFYVIDVFLNLAIVFLVLMCNLYLAFVAGASVQDVLSKLVILNFILDQQRKFKEEIFKGNTGRIVLNAIRRAYELGTPQFPYEKFDAGSEKLSQEQLKRREKILDLYGKELIVKEQILKKYSTDNDRLRAEAKEIDKLHTELAYYFMRREKEPWRITQALSNIDRIKKLEEIAAEGESEEDLISGGYHGNDLREKVADKARRYYVQMLAFATRIKRALADNQRPTVAEVRAVRTFDERLLLAKHLKWDQFVRLNQNPRYIDLPDTRKVVAMLRLAQPEGHLLVRKAYKRKADFEAKVAAEKLAIEAEVSKLRAAVAASTKEIFVYKSDSLKFNGAFRIFADGYVFLLGSCPIWMALAYVIFAPICKPGPNEIVVPSKFSL